MVSYSEIDAALDGGTKRRGRPPGSTATKKRTEVGAKQEAEAKIGWLSFFELLAALVNSDAEFNEREFEPMARSTVRIVELYPQLAIVLTILAFLSVPAQGVKFVKRIMDKRRHRDTATSEPVAQDQAESSNIFQLG